MRFLLFLALVALAKDPALPPYRPPVVPTPQPVEAVPSPYEGQLVVPAVDVATRVVLKNTIRYDVQGLAAGAGAAQALERQLAADPRWRVVDWDGGRVAYLRVADAKEWTVPLRGYHKTTEGVWRTAIVLEPWSPTSVWVTSPLVGHAAAAAPAIGIAQINYEGDPAWRAVAWEWGDPGTALEVFEAGPRATVDTMPHTNDALGNVPSLMARVGSAAAEIDAKGFAAALLPGRAGRSGEPTMTLASPASGELEVRAWLHTPGPGVTWGRVLDTQLQPWEEEAVAAGTREILGASSDPKQLFYLQGRFPVPAGPAMSGTVEFWHQPDGGGEVRRIAAFPITVPGR